MATKPPPSIPQKKGYLLALGQRGKQWKNRYFVIKDNFLHYFKQDSDVKPDGVIPLESCSVAPHQRGDKVDKDNCFELVACNRSYLLCAKDPKDMEEWISDLTRASKLTIEDFYELCETLGCGTFSKVKRAVHRRTGLTYAIKVIDKAALAENRESLLTEISILKQVKHSNVIGLIEIFETRRKLFLVMEMLTGGELFDRVVEKGTFSEKDASELMKKVLEATEYLHNLGIVHRDLKPENLLYTDKSDAAEIKVADFGLSKFVSANDLLKTACGTPGYVAPEVLTLQGYQKAVDLWSIGVILYILLCGSPPFYAENDADMFELIKEARYDFPEPYWTDISDSAKDLVRNLLQKDPKKRYTTKQALAHPWIAGGAAKNQVNEMMMETMKKFNARRKFRQTIHGVIATRRWMRSYRDSMDKEAEKATEGASS